MGAILGQKISYFTHKKCSIRRSRQKPAATLWVCKVIAAPTPDRQQQPFSMREISSDTKKPAAGCAKISDAPWPAGKLSGVAALRRRASQAMGVPFGLGNATKNRPARGFSTASTPAITRREKQSEAALFAVRVHGIVRFLVPPHHDRNTYKLLHLA